MTRSAAAAHLEVMSEERSSTHDARGRDALVEEIARRAGVRAERGRRFAELTSLRVGGAIDWLLVPETEGQAASVVGALEDAGIAWRVLGAGSNVLADDREHRYVVVSMREVKGGRVRRRARLGRRGLLAPAPLRRGRAPRALGHRGSRRDSRHRRRRALDERGRVRAGDGSVVESVRVARGGRVVEVPGAE